MVFQLTTGAIMDIMTGKKVEKPVLQVLSSKQIISGSGSCERYRLFVSDGKNSSSFAMLATQLNHHIHEGNLDKFTVIRLDHYVCNEVQSNKYVIIVLELVILAPGREVGVTIGNPTMVTTVPTQDGPSATSATQRQNANPNTGRDLKPANSPRKSTPLPNSYYNQSMDSISSSLAPSRNVHSIASLTPYQNKWTIRARVTNKSAIRPWSNSRGEGTLFSMDLLDESGEIRCTAFRDQCEKFFPMIEVNKVYYISRGSVKTANKTFSNLKNDYELSFTNETTVEPCSDNTGEIPLLQFSFVPISDLQQIEKDTIVDVIGVCKSASDLQNLTSRSTNRELKKRDVHLVDKTNTEVTLTLWGEQAEKFDASNNPVVAMKGVRVSDFGGCSLTTGLSSMILLDPKIPEADSVRSWYKTEGCNHEAASLSRIGATGGGFATNWKYLKDTGEDSMDCREKPEYFTVKAVVTLIKSENCMYQACPTDDCNKKVVDMSNGTYRCEKCNKQYNEFKWRLLLQISISDFSDNMWITCFQESAEAILGMTAEKLGLLKENDEGEFTKVLQDANFKEFIFKLRSKMDNFQDEQRLRTTAITVTPINYVEYNKKLIEELQNMIGGSTIPAIHANNTDF